MIRTTLTLSKDEVDNLVDFFELEFLPMVRKDDTIDNLRYLTSMGAVYGKLEAAQKILKEGIDEFLQWMRMDEVSKQISVHAERMLKSANEESEKLLRSMPDLSEEDRHRVQMMYERFAKKMANDFLYKVKAENSPEDVQVFLKCLGANND